ncbi:MAG TPA: CHASE3 domain-containing protein, partial [Clostridia bacterium]|nr:CHASE3 domain-containing protein [Clostridia bacterium]
LKISYKLYLGFGIFTAIMLFISGYTYINFKQVASTVDASLSSYQVILESNGIKDSLIGMETSLRGYIITGEDNDLRLFRTGNKSFIIHYDRMRELLPHDPPQQERLDSLYAEYQFWTIGRTYKKADYAFSKNKKASLHEAFKRLIIPL